MRSTDNNLLFPQRMLIDPCYPTVDGLPLREADQLMASGPMKPFHAGMPRTFAQTLFWVLFTVCEHGLKA